MEVKILKEDPQIGKLIIWSSFVPGVFADFGDQATG